MRYFIRDSIHDGHVYQASGLFGRNERLSKMGTSDAVVSSQKYGTSHSALPRDANIRLMVVACTVSRK